MVQLALWGLKGRIICPICGAQTTRKELKISFYKCCYECDNERLSEYMSFAT